MKLELLFVTFDLFRFKIENRNNKDFMYEFEVL